MFDQIAADPPCVCSDTASMPEISASMRSVVQTISSMPWASAGSCSGCMAVSRGADELVVDLRGVLHRAGALADVDVEVGAEVLLREAQVVLQHAHLADLGQGGRRRAAEAGGQLGDDVADGVAHAGLDGGHEHAALAGRGELEDDRLVPARLVEAAECGLGGDGKAHARCSSRIGADSGAVGRGRCRVSALRREFASSATSRSMSSWLVISVTQTRSRSLADRHARARCPRARSASTTVEAAETGAGHVDRELAQVQRPGRRAPTPGHLGEPRAGRTGCAASSSSPSSPHALADP